MGKVGWCWPSLIFPKASGHYWCLVIFSWAFRQFFWLRSFVSTSNWKSKIIGTEVVKSSNKTTLKYFFLWHFLRLVVIILPKNKDNNTEWFCPDMRCSLDDSDIQWNMCSLICHWLDIILHFSIVHDSVLVKLFLTVSLLILISPFCHATRLTYVFCCLGLW